jgi:class 3 adenylate cyclase
MPEERRIVTILFADVTGSTELGESLDPEDVRALLGR